MRDRLRSVLDGSPEHLRPGLIREFLQCMALRALHEGHDFGCIAFVGGTALRLAYGLPRFSEDLDFSLVEGRALDFERIADEISRHYAASGVDADISRKEKGAVRSLWLKFPKLLHEMGVTSDLRRILSIKLEVDGNPPHGAMTERRLINRHFPIAVVLHDLPSLFAGKLHAVLTRAYVKGRDFYDLAWYRTRHADLVPNLTLLNAALVQTGWKGAEVDAKNWRHIVRERIEVVDWNEIVRDVSPFLEDEGDLKSMRLEYVLPLFA